MAPSSTSSVATILPPPAKQKLRPFAEIGRTGVKRFGGHLRHEFLEVLRGLNGIRVFREMRDNDSIVGAGMAAIDQIIAKASWFVKPGSDSPLAKEAADFVVTCIDDMSHSW